MSAAFFLNIQVLFLTEASDPGSFADRIGILIFPPR
jgi:hypothetical protein